MREDSATMRNTRESLAYSGMRRSLIDDERLSKMDLRTPELQVRVPSQTES